MTTTTSVVSGGFTNFLSLIRPHAPTLQFWGYELGNIIAAVAGAGGFITVWAGLQNSSNANPLDWIAKLFLGYPDVAITVGLISIITFGALISAFHNLIKPGKTSGWIDGLSFLACLPLIAWSLSFGVNWITASAIFFVSASALLRQCDRWPVLLKYGGLFLTGGGACLLFAGLASVLDQRDTLLGLLTAVSGLFVAFAGLLTYQGGIFATSAERARQTRFNYTPKRGFFRQLTQAVDNSVLWFVKRVVHTALFWISSNTKTTAPLLTSMWARLPFRVLMAITALATFNSQNSLFAIACVLWAIGDVAIGSMDEQTIV